MAILKLDYKSVAPVANCISDLQTQLGLAGGWREGGRGDGEYREYGAKEGKRVNAPWGKHFIDLSIIR